MNWELRRRNRDMYKYLGDFQNKSPEEFGRIGYLMVHEEVWQTMVDGVGADTHWSREGVSLRETFRADLNDAIKLAKDQEKEVIDSLMRLTFRVFSSYAGGNITIHAILQALNNNEDPEPLIESLLDFMCFNEGMAMLRKAYFPSCGKGSQSEEHDLHLAMARKTVEIIQGRKD